MKINVAKSIFELLIEQGRVNVEGLGSFSLKELPASFGDGRSSLLPPSVEISYTEKVEEQDNKLRKRIAKSNDLEKDVASAYIQKFSGDILSGLMEKGKVEIAYLGTLSKSSLGDLKFEQNAKTRAELNKGFPEVVLPKMGQKAREEVSSVKVEEGNVGKVVEPVVKENVALVESAWMQEASGEKKKRGVGRFLMPLVALLLLGACGFFGMKACGDTRDGEGLKTVEGGVLVDSLDKMEADTSDYKEEVIDNSSGNGTLGKEENQKAAAGASEEKCVMILGSYSSEENANQMIEKVKRNGYETYSETNGRNTRVGLAIPCEDISSDCKAFRKKIRSQFRMSSAWYLNDYCKD